MLTHRERILKVARSELVDKISWVLRIIVGGAPVNQKFAERIGADGYARDAGEAISLVKQLLKDSVATQK